MEPLHFLAIEETALAYPGVLLAALTSSVTSGGTPQARASQLDRLIAYLLVYLSAAVRYPELILPYFF